MQIGEPPPSRKKPSANWVNKVSAIKALDPEVFGMVGNFSVGVATHIRNGEYPAFLPANQPTTTEDRKAYVTKHWLITTRKTPDGRNDVWIRWLGHDCDCEHCRAEV